MSVKRENAFVKTIRRITADDRKFGVKFFVSLAVYISFAYLVLFSIPCQMYLENIQDFIFSFTTLVLIMGIFSVVFVAVATALTMLLKGWLFDCVLSFFLALSLASFVQGNYMNGILVALDGTVIEWNMHTKEALINLAIWFVIMMIPLIVRLLSRGIWTEMLKLFPIMLVIVQTIVFVFLIVQTDFEANDKNSYISKRGMCEVSDKNNVIVFVLDYFDNRYADSLEQSDPEFFDRLEGFTRYTNSTSQYRYTMPSLPYLLTGVNWDPTCDLWSYTKTAFENSDFIPDLYDMDCNIGLYTDPMHIGSNVTDCLENYVNRAPDIRAFGVVKAMGMCTAYRTAPIVLKPFFEFYTNDLKLMSLSAKEDSLIIKAYAFNDAEFKDDISTNGLRFTDEECDAAFRFYHLYGTHPPYEIDAEANASDSATLTSAALGSFNIVFRYLDMLKELGVYDSSTIIITADHGVNRFHSEQVLEAADRGEVYFGNSEPEGYVPTPIMFVKPAGKGTGDSFSHSSAPVQQTNLIATVIKALDPDNDKYGDAVYEVDEDAEITRYYYFRQAYAEDPRLRTVEYAINGNSRDIDSWSVTGEMWEGN